MNPATILLLINGATDLTVRLIAAYNALPDADADMKAALAAQLVQLEATAKLVAEWRPVPLDDGAGDA